MSKQAKTLNERELQRLLDFVKTTKNAARNRAILLLTHLAGMRIGEVAAFSIVLQRITSPTSCTATLQAIHTSPKQKTACRACSRIRSFPWHFSHDFELNSTEHKLHKTLSVQLSH